MSLLSYFQIVQRDLLDPAGPLSSELSPSAIAEANTAVNRVQQAKAKETKKRGPYIKFDEKTKIKIGKYSSENGVHAAARHFSMELGKNINPSTIRGFKRAYLQEMNRKRRADEDDLTVTSLPAKKRGRPLLLGEELDRKIQLYLRAIRESGGAVNTAIALGAARGIILKLNRTLLVENGGHVDLTKAWAKGLLTRMGYVKRRGTTSKSKNLVENFEELKASFLEQVSTTVIMDEIPPGLILNWDQTGLNLIPSSSWTMEQRGARRVEITGLNDKRMITAVFCGTLCGDFLPIQLVYQGKTDRCHPKYNFPEDWHITHSPNHWSTEETMKDYLNHILFPYINRVRASYDLDDDYPALAIFDNFKGQITGDVLQLLEDHNVHSVRLPANCTDRLQPMDISVNKAAKDFVRQKFNEWYSEKVAEQLGGGTDVEQQLIQPVDLTGAALKTIGAKWLVQMHEYLQDNPGLIVNGFRKAGIQEAIDSTNESVTASDSIDETATAIDSTNTTVIDINSSDEGISD